MIYIDICHIWNIYRVYTYLFKYILIHKSIYMHVLSDGKLGIHSLPCVYEAGGGAIAVLVGHSYIIRAMVWQ